MPFHYNILTGNTQVKGRIGEIIASYYLRRLGFIIYRPRKILGLLKWMKVPNNYEVRFLRRYQKTMDYFAILSEPDPLLNKRQIIYNLFKNGGLDKYMNKATEKGFVVEVKSKLDGSGYGFSKMQKRMFKQGKKMGFGIIVPIISFKGNYTVEVKLLDEESVI